MDQRGTAALTPADDLAVRLGLPVAHDLSSYVTFPLQIETDVDLRFLARGEARAIVIHVSGDPAQLALVGHVHQLARDPAGVVGQDHERYVRGLAAISINSRLDRGVIWF